MLYFYFKGGIKGGFSAMILAFYSKAENYFVLNKFLQLTKPDF